MKKFLPLILVLLSTLNFAEEYGAKFKQDKVMSLKDAIKNTGKNIVVKAKVGKVCEKKGCWMTLESEDKDLRVTFKDYSFFVPMNLIGKKVLVQGELKSHTMSKNEARHFAKDAGKSKDEINKIISPITEYRMVASGIKTIK